MSVGAEKPTGLDRRIARMVTLHCPKGMFVSQMRDTGYFVSKDTTIMMTCKVDTAKAGKWVAATTGNAHCGLFCFCSSSSLPR